MNGSVTTDEARQGVDLDSLIGEFYPSRSELGQFVQRDSLPSPFDGLLDHESHMTVTVESFHRQPVDVVVHQRHSVKQGRVTESYTREITLVTQNDREVVQYGIVRLNPQVLQPEVWREIESRKEPLGRVLIHHDVMREVRLCNLWEISPTSKLASFFESKPRLNKPRLKLCGRTASIWCDGKPTIELLEIVCR